jgi:hypothetical protein
MVLIRFGCKYRWEDLTFEIADPERGGVATLELVSLAAARRIFWEMATVIATCQEEPRCDFCGEGGLNWGRPAQPTGNGGYAHVGCVDDYFSDQVREHEALIEASEP